MKQITPEIKAKIFALYWGQEILAYQHGGQVITSNVVDCWWLGKSKTYLEVKPLSSITDEDATELCGILKYKDDDYFTNNFGLSAHMYLIEHIENDKNGFLGYMVTESFRILEAADFLRSKGYALPAFGYSVNELVEAGVFKLKEEQQ